MPTYTTKNGRRVIRAAVMVDGISRKKWFSDDSKDTWRKAAEWEAVQKRELKTRTSPQEVTCTALTWLTAYLEYTAPRVGFKTIQEKQAACRKFIARAGDVAVEKITASIAATHLAEQAALRSGHAANKDRKNLSHAWEWGRKFIKGFPATIGNPFAQADRLPETRQPRYVPSETDFWAVVDVCQGQDRVLLLTALHLALRRGELFALTWSDIDWGNNAVRIYTSKRKGGHREFDWLPMTTDIRKELRQWWEQRPIKTTTHVFTQIYASDSRWHQPGAPYKQRQHFMDSICKKAGVKPFGYHAIRHLSASILYKAGYPIAVIQRILRHKAPTTTERYLRRLGLLDLNIDDQVFSRPGKVIPLQTKKTA